MAELNDFTLDQLLALGPLAEASPEFQALSRRQVDEVRLLQLRHLMAVHNKLREHVVGDDPQTWVMGDEADSFFDQHVLAWHVNLLLNLLDEARAGHYEAHNKDVPQPPADELPFPYNVALDDSKSE